MANNSKYRSERRITTYVDPKVKKKVIAEGRKANRSPSQEAAFVLSNHYYGDK
jgi:hypothetical protein